MSLHPKSSLPRKIKTEKEKISTEKRKMMIEVTKTSLKSCEDDDCPCLIGGELYKPSLDGEGWSRCYVCYKWAHDACAGIEEDDDDNFQCRDVTEAYVAGTGRCLHQPVAGPGTSRPAGRAVDRTDGRGGVVVRLLASRLGEPGSFPGGVTPGFSHVGIVLGYAAGRRVFSGISRILPPPQLHSGAAPYSPRFTLIGSQDLDAPGNFAPINELSTTVCPNHVQLIQKWNDLTSRQQPMEKRRRLEHTQYFAVRDGTDAEQRTPAYDCQPSDSGICKDLSPSCDTRHPDNWPERAKALYPLVITLRPPLPPLQKTGQPTSETPGILCNSYGGRGGSRGIAPCTSSNAIRVSYYVTKQLPVKVPCARYAEFTMDVDDDPIDVDTLDEEMPNARRRKIYMLQYKYTHPQGSSTTNVEGGELFCPDRDSFPTGILSAAPRFAAPAGTDQGPRFPRIRPRDQTPSGPHTAK
ncbi:hypothetical protein PR048_003681 [Dryococelus australis]|uniref:Uncharacterized protein n=1 Tax=Dryococelus australis TaxID=614101 RepID=A0ABQ9INQ1_9NEOP|nr:hypothetical protein PR048_003681 [Dryococelus australis]